MVSHRPTTVIVMPFPFHFDLYDHIRRTMKVESHGGPWTWLVAEAGAVQMPWTHVWIVLCTRQILWPAWFLKTFSTEENNMVPFKGSNQDPEDMDTLWTFGYKPRRTPCWTIVSAIYQEALWVQLWSHLLIQVQDFLSNNHGCSSRTNSHCSSSQVTLRDDICG